MSRFFGRTFDFFSFQGLERREGLQVSGPLTRSRAPSTNVNFENAMQVSAFWACVKLLAETIASMPIRAYRTQGASRVEDRNFPLWRTLNYAPNRFQTKQEFFETVALNLVTTGNTYCAIERTTRGGIVSLIPLMSGQMRPVLEPDGSIVYHYTASDGTLRVYAAESIWHVKLFGNGITGLSPLGYMAKSLGVAIDSDDRAATLAASGGKTNGVLMVDKLLTKDQRERIRENFADLTEGRTDQLFVLEANMSFERTSLSPQDMQLLETRKFQTEDVARFMGVPSVLINDHNGTTAWGSGIYQIIQGFYKLGLRPYLERFEASIKRHLMTRREWDQYDIEFDFDALLRADLATRMEANNKAINSGQMTPNEARKDEGREPQTGGERIYLNSTLVPAGTLIRVPQGGGNVT